MDEDKDRIIELMKNCQNCDHSREDKISPTPFYEYFIFTCRIKRQSYNKPCKFWSLKKGE